MIYSILLPVIAIIFYVLFDATAQGKLGLLTRRYVPQNEQPAVNLPLHQLYPACYAVLVLALAYFAGWHLLAVGALARIALFDPVLNAAKQDPAFAVGSSAWLDKLLRRLSPAHPERLSAVLRLSAGALAVAAAVVAATHNS